MFVLRWLRKILALPLLWIGQLLLLAKMPPAVGLLKAAWIVSGDGEWGRIALAAVHALQGPQAAMACAADWMARRPSAPLAAMAGLRAIGADNLDGAADYLRRGRELGNDRDGLLELLELLLACRRGIEEEEEEVVHRFLKRRDLSSATSKGIQSAVCWDTLLAGQWDEASRQARRLLEIEPNVDAEMVLWAIAKARGDDASAQAHLAAVVNAPPSVKQFLEAEGNAAIGRYREARDIAAAMRQEYPDLAQRLENRIAQREAAS
jgi:hypothetical protein